MKQFCGSIEECCFEADGVCCYCGRKEGKKIRDVEGWEPRLVHPAEEICDESDFGRINDFGSEN